MHDGALHCASTLQPRASRGFVFETLVAKQDPYVPKLDEVMTMEMLTATRDARAKV